MIACQDSRSSGSAAIADNSLCHRVIQSCASFRGSGISGLTRSRDRPTPDSVVSWSGGLDALESCPALSRPASIAIRHPTSEWFDPDTSVGQVNRPTSTAGTIGVADRLGNG
jgi:hypothetical protein